MGIHLLSISRTNSKDSPLVINKNSPLHRNKTNSVTNTN